MDERVLRQLLHEAFDSVPPISDPFRLVREAGVRPPARRHLPLIAAAAILISISVVTMLVLSREMPVRQSAPASVPPTAGAAIAAPTPGEVAQTASVASEYPTPSVSAWNRQLALASVGDEILRTADGGQTWLTVQPGRLDHAGNVRDLEWVTRMVALAAANYGLLRSDDGGLTWRLVNTRTDLRRLDFVSGSEGYVVAGTDAQGGDWHLLRTTDGGASFADYPVGLFPVTWAQWVTDTRAWAAGPGGVVTTSDGGEHWQPQLTLRNSLLVNAQVGFVDEAHGFAYFRDGGTATGRHTVLLYYTSDGGRRWMARDITDTLADSNDELVVTGASSAEIVSQSAADGGMVHCRSFDSGLAWNCLPLTLPAQTGAREVARGSSRMLTALGRDRVVLGVSDDAGASWSAVTEVDAAAWTRR